jgi:integrase
MARPIRDIPVLSRRDGVYTASWYDTVERRTKRLSLRTRDKDEAQHRFAAFLTEGREIMRSGSPDGLTVSQALDDYFKEHVREKVADVVRQENAIRHLKEWFKNTPMREIDIPACRGYTDARRKGVVGGGARRGKNNKAGADATIRRELTVLKAAAGHAARWRRIPSDKMPTFELPEERKHENETAPWLSKDEVAMLIGAATGDLKAFICLAYWTGARRASIETLRVSQIDFKAGLINLAKPGERKTKKRKPVIPLYPEITDTLESLVAQAKVLQRDSLFPANVDFYRGFRSICAALGVESHKDHPHVLRHSRVTHRLMDGDSIYKVARSVGDTVATIERVYGHWSAEFMQSQGGN